MTIKLSNDAEKRLIGSIKRYLDDEFEEEIGDLKASMFLEFCLKEIGPSIYNRAVLDVQTHVAGRVADLDGECSRPEFTYWKK